MELMCVWQRSHLRMETLCAGDLSAWKSTMFSQTRKHSKCFPCRWQEQQRHTVHGHRKITAILDDTLACFHKDMDELIHAHPPRETEPECIVAWSLFTAHSGARRAARLWQEYFRYEVLMRAGWNADVMELNAYHKAEDLNNDDSDSFHGGGVEDGHQVGVPGRETSLILETRPVTWVRVEPRAAALTPNTAATHRMRHPGIEQKRYHGLVALQLSHAQLAGRRL